MGIQGRVDKLERNMAVAGDPAIDAQQGLVRHTLQLVGVDYTIGELRPLLSEAGLRPGVAWSLRMEDVIRACELPKPPTPAVVVDWLKRIAARRN